MSRRSAFASQLTADPGSELQAPTNSSISNNVPPIIPPAPTTTSTSSTRGGGGSSSNRGGRGGHNNRGGGGKQQRNNNIRQPQPRLEEPIPARVQAANLAAIAQAAMLKADQEKRSLRSATIQGEQDQEDVEEVEDEDEDGQICFICAEPVQYWALGSCNHRTCHTCSIRLRALYKKRECTFCKTECNSVIFTESESKLFEEYTNEMTPFSDTKLGILFETRAQLEDTLSLLRFNCPYRPNLSSESTSNPTSSSSTSTQPQEPCPQILTGWTDLKRHVRQVHHTTLCDLCCSNKKIFAHEHELFQLPHPQSLPNRGNAHQQQGNRGGRVESELDQHLEKHHSLCGFCKRWFYDSDGLYKHCREMHEECFVCVRNGIRHQYHLNYDRLEQHFKSSHYLCPHPECLAQKFVVFESELDLQAHALTEHGVKGSNLGGGGVGDDQKSRKEARRVETNFVYSTGATSSSNSGGGGSGGGGGRGGRGGGRNTGGAAAAASFVEPPATRQALGERSVPGLGGRRGGGNNGFGGQLTMNDSTTTPSSSGTNTPRIGAGGERDSAETVARHAGLMKRVQDAVGGNEGRVAAFRFAVRSYRANETSASDLVDQLFNIFDTRIDEAASLITGVADLFDDAEKRQAVLNAWRDTRLEETQFPSLAPLAPTLNGVPTNANNTSARALSAQHRSAQHPPSTTWDRVERAATSSGPAPIQPRSNPFPALMSASNAKNVVGLRNAGQQQKKRIGGPSTPWSVASASSGVSAFPSLSAPNSAPVTRQPSPSSFPSLSSQQPSSSSRPTISHSNSSSSSSTSLAKKASSATTRQPPPRASSGLEFPSLPTSSMAADARARMRAALQKPGTLSRTITDEGSTPPGERDPWGSNADYESGEGGAGGQGATSSSASSKKKGKGRQKVVLMSGGLAGRS